jgi:hypothetical protein
MTEAAAKVELRPETLLAHATHIAAADAAVEQALRGQPFLRWNGCAERNAQLGRARSSRNSVPSVRPQTRALEPLQVDRSSAGEGRPPRGLTHLRPSRFRQGAGIRIRCKEKGMTSWQQWPQHPERSRLRCAIFPDLPMDAGISVR